MPTFEEMSKEELIAALRALEASRPAVGGLLETAIVIHDLEVHQIELEMQNRQLRETEARLEAAMQRYRDLYDFAPIVYLTLDAEGRIQDANLTAATFLRTERGTLIGKPLTAFVAVSHRAQLRGHLQRCFNRRIAVSVDLDLSVSGMVGLPVKATSVPVLDDVGQVVGCRTALTDISALKRTEHRLVLLASASQTLAQTLDIETSMQEVLRSTVPSVADHAFIDLVHHDEIRRFAVRREPTEPSGVEITRSVYAGSSLRPDSPQARVLESGKPILVAHCDSSALSRSRRSSTTSRQYGRAEPNRWPMTRFRPAGRPWESSR